VVSPRLTAEPLLTRYSISVSAEPPSSGRVVIVTVLPSEATDQSPEVNASGTTAATDASTVQSRVFAALSVTRTTTASPALRT
jgi:hypothetical protein